MPAAEADTIPESEPMDAIDVLPLAQVPPGVTFVNVVPPPMHNVPVPDMAAGAGCTVTRVDVLQPAFSS